MRPSNEHQRRDLKTTTWALIDRIGPSVFAGMSRVKGPELSKYSAQTDERTIPVDVLLDAEIVAQNPMVTRLLAEMQGYALVPIEAGQAGAAVVPATIGDVLRAIKETGDVATAFLAADADGNRDALDRRDICREIDQAVAALLALRKGV
ncbi:MAG: hypothetical protein JWR80_7979 [Bradyrhizobium sp.]|nr:hypothetical protein [Bradyrhizobium sp.]